MWTSRHLDVTSFAVDAIGTNPVNLVDQHPGVHTVRIDPNGDPLQFLNPYLKSKRSNFKIPPVMDKSILAPNSVGCLVLPRLIGRIKG